MTIDFKTFNAEMLATPDDEARAIKLEDLAGNPYGQVTWIWIDGALNVDASKLPNGYEGQVLGVEDMVALHIEANTQDERETQAQDMALQLMLWGAAIPSSANEGGAGKPAIHPIPVEVKTERGVVLAHVACDGGFVQINLMHASQKPPIFVVLSEELAGKVIATIRALVEGAVTAETGARIDGVDSAATSGEHAEDQVH